jgi:hypothetical protein
MRIVLRFILCASLFFCACEASKFGFNAPVPVKGKKLQAFDNNLIGEYRLADTSRLLISETQCIDKNKSADSYFGLANNISITRDSLNNSLNGIIVLNKDSLSAKDKNELLFNQELDSDILNNIPRPVYFYEIDSNFSSYLIELRLKSNLFTINDSGVVIKYKDNYYLNTYKASMRQWICFQLAPQLKKNELSLNTISNDDITILNRLIDKAELNDSLYVPSMKVFKQFLKQGGFENRINFIKK